MDKEKFDQVFNEELGGMFGSVIAQDPVELWPVIQRLNALQPRRILEIGMNYGGTTRIWQELTREPVVAIDMDTSKIAVDFSKHIQPLLIQGDSTDPETIAKARELAPYDFLFIDGGHDYPVAKSDWDNYSPMVRPGGLIGFHDVKAPIPGPHTLVKEIGEAGFLCELFIDGKGGGMGIALITKSL